jgi:hypothetical protein
MSFIIFTIKVGSPKTGQHVNHLSEQATYTATWNTPQRISSSCPVGQWIQAGQSRAFQKIVFLRCKACSAVA